MNNQFLMSSSILLGLVLLMGCATVVHVTSNPPGARVYNASGTSQCRPVELGYQPYDHVQGRYRGNTPVSYTNLYWYDNVRVVWPDEEDSGWQQQPLRFGTESVFHFVKQNTAKIQAPDISRQSQSSLSTADATSEKLALFKALWERGDITEEEYRERRVFVLDSVSSAQPQLGASQRQSDREIERIPAAKLERMVAVTNAIVTPKARFSISVHVEDDPAKGDAILGNGDGLIQQGEAFNLVVVISNISTSSVKSGTCTVALPTNVSIKSYSKLRQIIKKLEPSVSATNRFILTVPLNSTAITAPSCMIKVQEEGSPVVEHLNYELPMKLEYP